MTDRRNLLSAPDGIVGFITGELPRYVKPDLALLLCNGIMITHHNSAVVLEKMDIIVWTSRSYIVEFDHINTPENWERDIPHHIFAFIYRYI